MSDLPKRYIERGELGAGGMGRVLRVFDRERNEEVALKRASGPEARFALQQEFWTMARLRHPNLVDALDYGEAADGSPYFTMALVPGSDLAPGMDEADVRAWLPGVLAALGFLHQHGYVHGDVKPENIRPGGETGPKLMDLGLLAPTGRAGGPIRGTLAYLAPECIQQGAIDGRADLYALGAVVFHLLAGRPPFPLEAPLAILRAHLHDRPLALQAIAPGVSAELAGVVARLLAKAPAARFETAHDVLAALGLPADATPPALLGSELVGRDAERARLLEVVEREEPAVLAVVGPAGAGKSRLLGETRAAAQLAGVPVRAFTGLGEDAAPYEALGPWLRALAAERPDLAPVFARAVPVSGVAPAAALEGPQELVRLQAAVAEAAGAPTALWIVDDHDRLDLASRALLDDLRRRGADLAWRWLWSTAAEPADHPALRLAPLGGPDAARLASALLGQRAPEAVSRRAAELSEGWPGAVEALVAHWVRSGALEAGRDGWEPAPGRALDLPPGVAALDADDLPAPARTLARAAAALGTRGAVALLTGLGVLADEAFFEAVAALSRAGLMIVDGGTWTLTRPAWASTLAAAMPHEERAALNQRAADWLVATVGEGPDLAATMAIATHRLAGPTPAEAAPWVTAAVARALAMHAAGGLLPMVERALAAEGLAPAARAVLQGQRVAILRFLGRLDEALAAYEADVAPALAELPAAGQADLRITYGTLLQQKGRYDEARAAFAAALALADEAGAEASAVRAAFFDGRVAYFAGAPAETPLADALARARRAPGQPLLGKVMGLYGYVLGTHEPDRAGEALALLEAAIALDEATGDLHGRFETLNNRGNLLLAAGRPREARADFAACLQLMERIGSPNERVFCHLNLGAADLELGDARAARGELERALELARRQGRKFPEGFASAYLGLALVRLGEAAAGLEALERGLALAREIANRYMEANVRALEAEARLHLGQREAAREALSDARSLVAASGSHELDGKLRKLEAALDAPAEPPAPARLFELAELAAIAAEAGAVEPLLEAAIALFVARCGLERGFLLLYDGFQLTHKVYHAMTPDDEDAYSESIAREALLGGQPVYHEDAGSQVGSASVQALALRTVLAVPMHDGGEAIGVLLADSRRTVAPVGEAEQDAALALAVQAGALVALVRGRERQRAEAEALAAAQRLIMAMLAGGGWDALLGEAIALVGAERGLVLSGLDARCEASRGAGVPDGFSRSAVRWVQERGETLSMLDAPADEQLGGARSIMALGLRTIVAVPIPRRSGPPDVLYLDSQRMLEVPPTMLRALARAGEAAGLLADARGG